MWNEIVAHRGANEVVSSLAHFIFNTKQVKQEQNRAFGGLIIVLVKIKTTMNKLQISHFWPYIMGRQITIFE